MQRSLRLSLSLSGIAALALSNGALLPATAQEGSAEDLGVMSISLADVVKPTIGFQGALPVSVFLAIHQKAPSLR
jgi:hypothetical protein